QLPAPSWALVRTIARSETRPRPRSRAFDMWDEIGPAEARMPGVSDTSGPSPPPPPPSVPPPTFGAPLPPPPIYTPPPPTLPKGYKLPPGYAGPIAPDYTQPYQGYPQPYGQPANPGSVVFGSTSALGFQFGGRAIY